MKRSSRDKYLLDTSFLIAALEESRSYAVEALDVLIRRANANDIDIFIAATVDAEMKCKNPAYKKPEQIATIAFGMKAADILAGMLGFVHIRPPGQVRGYWKFDAITLAVAMSADVKYLVNEDDDFEKMVSKIASAGIRAIRSEEARDGETGRPIAEKRRAAEREKARQESMGAVGDAVPDSTAHIPKMKGRQTPSPRAGK